MPGTLLGSKDIDIDKTESPQTNSYDDTGHMHY